MAQLQQMYDRRGQRYTKHFITFTERVVYNRFLYRACLPIPRFCLPTLARNLRLFLDNYYIALLKLGHTSLMNLRGELQAGGDITKALQDLEERHGDRSALVVHDVLEAKDVTDGRTLLKQAVALGKTAAFTQLAHEIRSRVSSSGNILPENLQNLVCCSHKYSR